MLSNKMLIDNDEAQGYNWEHESENNFEIIDEQQSLFYIGQKLESDRKRKTQKRPNNIRLGMVIFKIFYFIRYSCNLFRCVILYSLSI